MQVSNIPLTIPLFALDFFLEEISQKNAVSLQRPRDSIAVNRYFQTNDPAVYAIGDVAAVDGKMYPFVAPIRSQVKYLSKTLFVENKNSIDKWEPQVLLFFNQRYLGFLKIRKY